MLILKVISALLSYPHAEMLEALGEMADFVEKEVSLPTREKTELLALIESFRSADALELQQRYVELFDRGRALSLHLFEHIHGESRDRGQAMVDLMRVYQSHGFEITARELPDHIPLFLEYLSQRPADESIDLLRAVCPVLNLLGARLFERSSPYAALFDALAAVAGETADRAMVREQAVAEGPDETLTQMDEIWEEELVSFMANPGICHQPTSSEQIVNFIRRGTKTSTRSTP